MDEMPYHDSPLLLDEKGDPERYTIHDEINFGSVAGGDDEAEFVQDVEEKCDKGALCQEMFAMDFVPGPLPLKRALFGLASTEMEELSNVSEDLSTEMALDEKTSEPGTCRQSDDGTCGTMTGAIRTAGTSNYMAISDMADSRNERERFEACTMSEVASIAQFGCIGAEAVRTLEKVSDAECWHNLHKQIHNLNSVGSSPGKATPNNGRPKAFHGLLEAKSIEEHEEAKDKDVWANLRRQIDILSKEVSDIAERHTDGAHQIEQDNARQLQEKIDSNDLNGQIARLEVDVHELVGAGCSIADRKSCLKDQLSRLSNHVCNVVHIADNLTKTSPIAFCPKQLVHDDVVQSVVDMQKQVALRARRPVLAPRLERVEADLSNSSRGRTLMEPVVLESRSGSARVPDLGGTGSVCSTRSCANRAASCHVVRSESPFFPCRVVQPLHPQTPSRVICTTVRPPPGSSAGATPKVVRSASPIRTTLRPASPLRSVPRACSPLRTAVQAATTRCCLVSPPPSPWTVTTSARVTPAGSYRLTSPVRSASSRSLNPARPVIIMRLPPKTFPPATFPPTSLRQARDQEMIGRLSEASRGSSTKLEL